MSQGGILDDSGTTPVGPGRFPITPYVVGPVGQAGYQTVQSALNAIGAGGSGAISLFPGVYTEDLVFPNGINVAINSICDEDAPLCRIVGMHTPPVTGNILIWRVSLFSNSHIFNSNAAGSTNFAMGHNNHVENGYMFNLPNWTGNITTFALADLGSPSAGIINNLGGSPVFLLECSLGVGSANPLILSGFTVIEVCNINCPIQTTNGAVINFYDSNFFNNVLLGGSTSGFIANSYMAPGAQAALTYNSSGNTTLTGLSIDTTNNPAINGTSTGTLTIGSVTFVHDSHIAATVTKLNPSTFLSGELRAGADIGGQLGCVSVTNANTSTIGAGTGTVKMSTGNSANSAVWIKVYVGTTPYWIPGWSTNAP